MVSVKIGRRENERTGKREEKQWQVDSDQWPVKAGVSGKGEKQWRVVN